MRTVEFSGYTWQVKNSGEGKQGLGPNYFSSLSENVWVDSQGHLHLRMTHGNNRWHCAEMFLEKPLGYGTYEFFVIGRFDLLDPRTVVGLFLYGDDEHEIDIEFARWGNVQGDNLQYVLQAVDPPGNMYRCDAKLNGDYTTHSIIWKPKSVSFRSLHGHYEEPPSDGYVISQYRFGRAYHVPTNECVHLNLWLYRGQPPMLGKEQEIVLARFAFYA